VRLMDDARHVCVITYQGQVGLESVDDFVRTPHDYRIAFGLVVLLRVRYMTE